MAKVIVVCNQKGGVGKTTTTVNLAASLAAAEKKTLVIDMDPQGNAGSGLSIDKGSVNLSIYDVLSGEVSIEQAIYQTELAHLQVVPAHIDLVGLDIEEGQNVSRETILLNAIAPIRDRYDYIMIDCPPSLSLLTVNSLTAANYVLVPVQCEYYALEGVADLMQTIDLIRRNLNSQLDLIGVLLTMFDVRVNLSHQVTGEIRGHFAEKVFKTVIPRNVRLSEAPSHGKPILLYDIRSIGAARYLELAQEVIARTSGEAPAIGRVSHAATTQSAGEGVVISNTTEAGAPGDSGGDTTGA